LTHYHATYSIRSAKWRATDWRHIFYKASFAPLLVANAAYSKLWMIGIRVSLYLCMAGGPEHAPSTCIAALSTPQRFPPDNHGTDDAAELQLLAVAVNQNAGIATFHSRTPISVMHLCH
jgi:hypothetical protein